MRGFNYYETKVYLRTTEGEFKRFINHKNSFNNSTYRNDTTLQTRLGHQRKIQQNPSFEMVPCKDSSIMFKHNQKVFAMPPRKIRTTILP